MLAPSVLSFIIGEQTRCLIVHIRHDFDKPKILMYLSALAQRSLPEESYSKRMGPVKETRDLLCLPHIHALMP